MNKIKRFLKRKFIELKYKNRQIVMPVLGIGETTILALFMKEYKKRFQKKNKNVILVRSNELVDYVKHFEGVDDVITVGTDFVSNAIKKYESFQNKDKGKIFLFHNPQKKTLPKKQFYTMIERFKYMIFNNNEAFELGNFTIDSKDLNKVKKKYNLQKNVCLIIPEANALNSNCVESMYWKNLIENMSKKGYQVFVNSNNHFYSEHCNYIYDTIYNTVLLASQCKYIISFRTGLIDAIAATLKEPYIISLYPSDTYSVYNFSDNKKMKQFFLENCCGESEYIKNNFSEFILNIHSLKTMFNRENTLECIVDSNKEKLFNDINNLIKSI